MSPGTPPRGFRQLRPGLPLRGLDPAVDMRRAILQYIDDMYKQLIVNRIHTVTVAVDSLRIIDNNLLTTSMLRPRGYILLDAHSLLAVRHTHVQ